mgnify:CR=1 FL=1
MRNLLQHFDGSDADRLERSIGTVSCHGVELVDDGLGLVIRDFAETGVMAVEPFGWHGGDEELGAVGAVPPVPVPSGQPPWIMKSLMMRWKVRPS